MGVAGPWTPSADGLNWHRSATEGDRSVCVADVTVLPGEARWWVGTGGSSVDGVAETVEAAKDAADAELQDRGWSLVSSQRHLTGRELHSWWVTGYLVTDPAAVLTEFDALPADARFAWEYAATLAREEADRAARDRLTHVTAFAKAQAVHRPYGPDAAPVDVLVSEARREVWEDVVSLLCGERL